MQGLAKKELFTKTDNLFGKWIEQILPKCAQSAW